MLLTHVIRMSAYNSESALARMIRPHYARGHDEARALLREAFTLSGDLQIANGTLHIRLDPASAPRRSKSPRRALRRTHRHRDALPRHRPHPHLLRQRPPRDCVNDLTRSGDLGSGRANGPPPWWRPAGNPWSGSRVLGWTSAGGPSADARGRGHDA